MLKHGEKGGRMKPLTAVELQRFIGRSGKYKANGFSFFVSVINARCSHNILELLVRPVAGEGESWVGASFVILDDSVETPGPTEEKETIPIEGNG